MATQPLPRFLEDRAQRIEHARKLEAVVRESAGDLREQKKTSHTAVDSIALRGIPAIGRGVAGVIHGTQPGT